MEAPDLVLALPSKGRLQELALQFLSQCGLAPQRVGTGREYTARLGGTRNGRVLYLRPEEIPARVEQGEAHAGITGEDLFQEFGEGAPASCTVLRELGFGAARLVVAVPRSWIDVTTLRDLDEAASQHRQTHGRGLRVATKFPRLTRAFLAEHGVADYQIVESLGATEGAPASGTADLVVDLTSTGATLVENHLKELSDGTVLRTDTCLIASLRDSLWNERSLAALEQIVEQIEARRRGGQHAVLRFTTPSTNRQALRDTLVAEYGCSIVSWSGSDAERADDFRGEGVITCPRAQFFAAAGAIRAGGGGPVLVDHCEFLFDGPSRAMQAFREQLKR